MPNRSSSEREPEYQALKAGRSRHKGMIDFSAEGPVANSKKAQQQEAGQLTAVLKPTSTIRDRLFKWTSHLFQGYQD